jgi:hypothetical protein
MFKHFIVFLLICMLPKLALTAEHWQASNYIIGSFIEIALKNEFDSKPAKLRKWNKPVHVWLDHKGPENQANKALHTNLVRMHLDHLEELTGQYVGLVANEAQADMKVIFTSEKQWKRDIEQTVGSKMTPRMMKAVCMAALKTNGKSEISSAVVIIPVDQAIRHRKLVTCIVEEITQVMGLPNDSDSVFPSIFNDKTPNDLLTGLDGLLLQLLYHPDLEVGMTAAEVMPVMRTLVTEMQIDGTVDNAVKTVKKGELYPLMGF